jgi:hypothetical protein
MPDEFKYWAFLSYSHQDNVETRADGSRGHIRWAEWLHDSLETYRVPAEFRMRQTRIGEPMPERFYPVFQDEKELPINADLGESIRSALRQSRFLIVICSPRSATSRYVNEEVRYFKELGRGDRIMTLMIDGEPNVSFANKAGFSPDEECFCGRWFLADRSTRTISPFSKVTVPEYIENRIKDNRAESLNEAEQLAVGNSQVLERIQRARQALKQQGEPATQH